MKSKEDFFIPCVQLPPDKKGGVGRIVIGNSRKDVDEKNRYVMTIPFVKKQEGLNISDLEMVIFGKIENGYLCLPLNGGYLEQEFPIEFKKIKGKSPTGPFIDVEKIDFNDHIVIDNLDDNDIIIKGK
jgi:hypothetical protein